MEGQENKELKEKKEQNFADKFNDCRRNEIISHSV